MKQLLSLLLLSLAIVPGAGAEALRAVPVELREVDLDYSADGVVEAVRQSTVAAQISGRIVEVNFDAGDRVQKGQVIVRIDEREVSQQLAGSEALVAQAQANLRNAELNYERAKQLFERKFVSRSALDRAEAEYKAAHAQFRATQAGAGAAATTRGFATVVAPYSGVVAQRLVEVGEMAQPGRPLMTGFDPSEMRVAVSVPQYKLTEVSKARAVTVEIPALGRTLPGSGLTVLPVAEARTLTNRLRVNLPPNQPDLLPGMFARVRFVTGRAKKLVVPAAAVVRRSEVTAVYVVDGEGVPRLRQVRLGEALADGLVEVLAGLSPGEKVALEPVKAGMVK